MADLRENVLFEGIAHQQEHWYYDHKIKIIKLFLQPYVASHSSLAQASQPINSTPLRCLDMGAGNGIISRSIGSQLDGIKMQWDLIDTGYAQEVLGEDGSNPCFYLYTQIPQGVKYDIILATDVIEHVQNDKAFIRDLAAHLSPNGCILISAPAFQMLWSQHDVYLRHYRRYLREELAYLVASEGLLVLRSGFIYIALFPFALLHRTLRRLATSKLRSKIQPHKSDLRTHPRLINKTLRSIMGFERIILMNIPIVDRFFGISCYCIARHH